MTWKIIISFPRNDPEGFLDLCRHHQRSSGQLNREIQKLKKKQKKSKEQLKKTEILDYSGSVSMNLKARKFTSPKLICEQSAGFTLSCPALFYFVSFFIFILNRKIFDLNPTRHSTGPRNPTSLRRSG